MPRVGDLTKCKIYKITSMNNPELVYYGHTCQTLSQRFATHKGVYNTSKSKIIIEKGDAVIILIENYPCETEDQARAREAFYILNNPCINKVIPGRSKRQYEIDNKDKIREYKKQYKIDNKEQLKEYKKQWYEKKKLLKSQLLNNVIEQSIEPLQV